MKKLGDAKSTLEIAVKRGDARTVADCQQFLEEIERRLSFIASKKPKRNRRPPR